MSIRHDYTIIRLCNFGMEVCIAAFERTGWTPFLRLSRLAERVATPSRLRLTFALRRAEWLLRKAAP